MLSKSKRINTSLAVSAVLLTTILGQTILTNNTNAAGDSASANASVVLNPTISLTLSSSDLTISSLNPSSYADSNSIDITVSTNALFGYYLSATAGDGNTSSTNHNNYLTNTANSDYKFTSLSSNKAALTNFDDGTWGSSYSRDNGSTWISGSQGGTTANGYNGLPVDNDDNGATGIALISTDSPTNNNSVKFKIGAKSSPTQAAGTYTNTINFYAVTNPEPPETMQDFAAGRARTTCSRMSNGDTITLIDSRDQTEYLIGKLADNRCWMLDNLALDLVANINNLNSSNTNASNITLGYLKNGGGSSPYTSTAVTYADSTSTYDTPQIAVSGDCYDAYCVNDPENGKWTSSSVTQQTINGGTSIYQGKIGAYYNHCAASAGSRCYASNSGTSDASEDICPAGWRLPTGGNSSEFNTLYSLYSSGNPSQVEAFQTAFHTPLSGYFFYGKARYQGYAGNFWASTYNPSTLYPGRIMYSLNIRSSSADSWGGGLERHTGGSVRCILSAS